MNDPIVDLVAGLPVIELDRARADRIRRRCQARLAATRARRPWHATLDGSGWAPALAALGSLYFVASVRLAVRLASIV